MNTARNIVRHCLTCIIIRKNTYLRHLSSRGSADPRESLRKCRISKLALSAHKVLSTPHGTGACRCAFKAGGKKIRVKYFRHPDGKCLVCNIWYDGKTVRECIKSCQRCSMRERRWLFIGGGEVFNQKSQELLVFGF